ncbi:TPA: hypothetical protein RMI67_004108 [Bacillus cereus]|nr:hypothetical protein [Bacillus cereus]
MFLVEKDRFSYNAIEITYIGIERLQVQLPIFLKREHLPMECSLTVAPFDKDKHIVKYGTALRFHISIFIVNSIQQMGAFFFICAA